MTRSAAIAIRAVAVVAAIAMADHWCVLPFRCNRAIRDARLLAESASTAPAPAVAARDAQRSIDLLQPYEATCGRTNVNVHMILAGNAVTLGRTDEALAHYDTAIAVQPRPEIYFERGMAKIAAHRAADGEADLLEAARFNPFFVDAMSGQTRRRMRLATHGTPDAE